MTAELATKPSIETQLPEQVRILHADPRPRVNGGRHQHRQGRPSTGLRTTLPSFIERAAAVSSSCRRQPP